jgi:hypothetical protein
MIEAGPMTQTDAVTLLKNKLRSLSDMSVAIDLVQALDLVPLAISQLLPIDNRASSRRGYWSPT